MYPTVILVVVALALGAVVLVTAGFYVLAAYIVRRTGKTAGIADIGRAVGAIITAFTGRHPRRR